MGNNSRDIKNIIFVIFFVLILDKYKIVNYIVKVKLKPKEQNMANEIFSGRLEYHIANTNIWRKREQLEGLKQNLKVNENEVKILKEKEANFKAKNRELSAKNQKHLKKAKENVENLKFTISRLEEYLGISVDERTK